MDREENLAILDSLAFPANQDRWDPSDLLVNQEPRATPAERARLVTMPSEEQELLDLVDLTAPGDRRDHLEPED